MDLTPVKGEKLFRSYLTQLHVYPRQGPRE